MDGSQGLKNETRSQLSKLAAKAVERAKGDRDMAALTLEKQIAASVALTREAVGVAARYLTRQAEWISRAEVAATFKGKAENGDNIKALMRVTAELYDTYVLPNGEAIGDARAKELDEAIDIHLHNEVGNRKSRSFIEAVRKLVKRGKTVRESVPLVTLTKLYKDYVSC